MRFNRKKRVLILFLFTVLYLKAMSIVNEYIFDDPFFDEREDEEETNIDMFLVSRNKLNHSIDKFVLFNHCFDEDKDLIVVIKSRASNFGARRVIRSTYGSLNYQEKYRFNLYFALASSQNVTINDQIMDENDEFADILQLEYIDNYKLNIIKSTAVIRWASLYCKSTKYLVYADDDIYLNVRNLLHKRYIFDDLSYKHENRFIFGKKVSNDVNRDMTTLWGIPRVLYPQLKYPKFVSGGAILMPMAATHDLWTSVLTVEPLLTLDDVVITGLAAKEANITIINDREVDGTMNCIYVRTDRRKICQDTSKAGVQDYLKDDIKNTFYIGHYLSKLEMAITHVHINLDKDLSVKEFCKKMRKEKKRIKMKKDVETRMKSFDQKMDKN